MNRISPMRFLRAAAAFVVLLAGGGEVCAQQYAHVSGFVLDGSHSGVPGALIALVNTEKRIVRTVFSNAFGYYSVPTVEPGNYRVTVQKRGFRPLTHEGIRLEARKASVYDFVLDVARLAQTIEVRATPLIATEHGILSVQNTAPAIHFVIPSRQVRDLPAPLSRNYQGLLVTLPGFLPPDSGGLNFNNPSRSMSYSPNGSGSHLLTWATDGAVSRNAWFQGQADYVPTLESVEAVNVTSGTMGAEQGYAGTTAVNVQTKSGTNERHGSAFWFHENQHLKARPYFLPAGQRQTKQIVNQAGGTLGGPLVRNRLFYFASYESTSNRTSVFSLAAVPTAGMRVGDMSESATTIYDPMTGQARGRGRYPFPGNRIPGSRISPVIRKVVELIPQSNFGDPSASVNNYYASGPWAFDRNQLDSKFNWNAWDRLQLNARFGFLQFHGSGPTRYGRLEGNKIGAKSGYSGVWEGWQTSMTYSAVYTVSPQMVLDGHFAYAGKELNALPPFLDENLGRNFLGIPGTNGPTSDYGGWPRLQISGYTTFGRGSNSQPSVDRSRSRQIAANLAWTRGGHNLRFGFDSIWAILERAEPVGSPGEFYFTNGVTQLKGEKASHYNGFASFLLGLPQNVTKRRIWNTGNSMSPTYSLYLRDRWQTARKLTLTFGLRWDYFPPPRHLDGTGFPTYNAATNEMTFCGYGDIPVAACGFQASKRQFSPRAGIAYRLTDSLVVRAGYGITWDPSNVARDSVKWFPASTTWSLAGDTNFDYVSRIEDGLPELSPPDLGSGVIELPRNFQVGIFDPHFRRQYIQSWNFILEKSFGRDWVGQVGYVANRGRRRPWRWDFNYSEIGGGNKSRVLYQPWGHTAAMKMTTSHGFNSQFDSLQATLEKRFSAGFMARLSYTFRRQFQDRNAYPNPAYWGLGKHTQSDADRPHGFSASFAMEPPFGRGKRWATRGTRSALLGGWQMNALLSAFSGIRFPVKASGSSLNAPGHPQHADQVKPAVAQYRDPDLWFDPLAYAPVTEERFGNSGWAQLGGPNYVNLDLGLFRTFKLSERLNLQFRAEAFNATNTPHFNLPGNNVNNLQLNPDGTIKNLNGFGQITRIRGQMRDGVDERVFRFGLRLSF